MDKLTAALAENKCPHCGAPLKPTQHIGRCLYASCGHRVGQVDSGDEV
jgi:hypothetical protein